MKKIITLLLVTAIGFSIASCHKGSGNPAPGTLNSNWQLVNDSTIYYSCGLCAVVTSANTNYVGRYGDYYNFNVNGTLYIKEGTALDTATYTLKQDTLQLTFSGYNGVQTKNGGALTYIVSNFTAHTLKLTSIPVITPSTLYKHIINLSK